MVSRFTGLWELIQLFWTIPIREIFHFHHLPKLYFGFNVVTELEEYLYLHALLFLIEFLDLARLRGVKGCWLDTGHMLSSGREGAAPLIVKMEDRLSGD